jgi:hypothetical protein
VAWLCDRVLARYHDGARQNANMRKMFGNAIGLETYHRSTRPACSWAGLIMWENPPAGAPASAANSVHAGNAVLAAVIDQEAQRGKSRRGNFYNRAKSRSPTRSKGKASWQAAGISTIHDVNGKPTNVSAALTELERRGHIRPRMVLKRKAWYIIDPRRSRAAAVFDIVVAVALIFTIIVTPWEISFLPPAEEIDGLFIVNRVSDFIFFIDMCLQFVLMYPTQGATLEGARWEDNPQRIVRHYLLTWFAIDISSLGISGLDCTRAQPAARMHSHSSPLCSLAVYSLFPSCVRALLNDRRVRRLRWRR